MNNEKFYAVTDTDVTRYSRKGTTMAVDTEEYARTNDVRWTVSWMIEFVEAVMTNPTDSLMFTVHQVIDTAIQVEQGRHLRVTHA